LKAAQSVLYIPPLATRDIETMFQAQCSETVYFLFTEASEIPDSFGVVEGLFLRSCWLTRNEHYEQKV